MICNEKKGWYTYKKEQYSEKFYGEYYKRIRKNEEWRIERKTKIMEKRVTTVT